LEGKLPSVKEDYLVKATIRGLTRPIILWLVEQKPMSGYNIMKELRRLTTQHFHSGIVYPLLYEMEEKGLIAGEWNRRGRRRIKCYSLTDKGKSMIERLQKVFKMPVRVVLKSLLGEDEQT